MAFLAQKSLPLARRLVSCLGLPEPPELRAVDEGTVRQTPLGSKVRVKEDFSIDSGRMLRQGELWGSGLSAGFFAIRDV